MCKFGARNFYCVYSGVAFQNGLGVGAARNLYSLCNALVFQSGLENVIQFVFGKALVSWMGILGAK